LNFDPSAFVADPALIQALERRANPIACSADQVLFRQGEIPEGLYIVRKGEATLTMTSPAGKAVISVQTAAGSLLGLPGLIGNEPYTLTALACTGAEIDFVSRDDFAALMQSDPFLSLKVLQVLAAEVRSARNAILQR
jgi:CRP-like cAMP-binding protein